MALSIVEERFIVSCSKYGLEQSKIYKTHQERGDWKYISFLKIQHCLGNIFFNISSL